AYWLTRCDGFDVVGGRRPATVEHAVFDDDPLAPVALRVRRPRGGTTLIPIEMVEGVRPTQRILYVRRPRSAASRAAGHVSARAPDVRRGAPPPGRAAAASWRYAAPRAGGAGRATIVAARRQWPTVRQGAIFVAWGALLVAVACSSLVRRGAFAAYRFAANRLAPRGARVADSSLVVARRAFRYGAQSLPSATNAVR